MVTVNRSIPAISPISFAAIKHAEALLGKQLRRDLFDEFGELLVELCDRTGQFPDPGRSCRVRPALGRCSRLD